jgi:hypothetical protein
MSTVSLSDTGANLHKVPSNEVSEIVYICGKWIAQRLAVLVFGRKSVPPAECLSSGGPLAGS